MSDIEQLKQQIINNKQELFELREKMKGHLSEFNATLTLYKCLLPSCKDQNNITELNNRINILETEIKEIKLLLISTEEAIL
jgi:hypothetical protein